MWVLLLVELTSFAYKDKRIIVANDRKNDRSVRSPFQVFRHSGHTIRSPFQAFRHSERAIRSPFKASDTPNAQSGHHFRYPDTFNTQNNLSQRQLGIRNNAHSAYWFISEYAFKPFSGYLLTSTSPPNLPFSKGRNGLSFSFTTIEFSLNISFWVAMQHTSPLEKGRKRGDYLYRTNVSQVFRLKMPPHSKRMQRHFCMVLHPAKKISGDGEKALPLMFKR